jgi:hypothetical protein
VVSFNPRSFYSLKESNYSLNRRLGGSQTLSRKFLSPHGIRTLHRPVRSLPEILTSLSLLPFPASFSIKILYVFIVCTILYLSLPFHPSWVHHGNILRCVQILKLLISFWYLNTSVHMPITYFAVIISMFVSSYSASVSNIRPPVLLRLHLNVSFHLVSGLTVCTLLISLVEFLFHS